MLSSSTAATVIGWPPDFRNTTSPGSNGMVSSCSWLGPSPYPPSMTNRSRPLHHRRQRREDRVDIAAGAQPEDGAAVVEQVELHVAAAAHELLLALGLAPRRSEERRVGKRGDLGGRRDPKKRSDTRIAREGQIG